MWRRILRLSAFAAVGLILLPGAAISQQKTLSEQLIGTWKIVSVQNMLPNRVPHRLPTIRLALATRRHRLLGEAFYSLPHGHSLAPKRQSRAYFAVGGIANRTRERVGATPQIREAHGRCLVSTRNIAVAWCTNALDGWWGHDPSHSLRVSLGSQKSTETDLFQSKSPCVIAN